ncbi:MAG: thioester reductase domain-containing protein [Cyanosarcina radialis HA8281-LM2]|jgi:thioester reductase-like protein|nr:thioester reductase domain-containing protein [Cyanosarcina radialis HA8281-LM2]
MNVQDSLESIAIIGMSGSFPQAKNIDEFWQNLQNGVESIAFFSDRELEALGIEPHLLNSPNYVKANGYLDRVELFDAAFFGFSPREAEIMDPQHRIFLEQAWQALENAGYDSETDKSSIGIYAGMSMSTYLYNNLLADRHLVSLVNPLQLRIFNDKDFLTSIVSYKLNLNGPSVTVQTACSTSLVAVCLACQSLQNYQCDIALAGGVSITIPQKTGYFYQEGGIVSPDGHCRAFDAEAKGSVEGNGVGVVVLKRLADALADRDCIHAVIKGTAINNDGAAKVGYTAPSVDGQAEAIAMAQAVAGIEAQTVTYIETHGTGTPIGDPIEIAALNQVFRTSTDRKNFCAIGSVKTNIGHLDAAAGIASLIKTVMALKHKLLPPSLHFKQPNPHIDFADSPFYVNARLTAWKAGNTPRRAGVSSFSMGGVNTHVVLEEASIVPQTEPSKPWQLLLLSAKTESALLKATDNLVAYLKQHPEANLADVAYTYQVGRRTFNHRLALVCRNLDEAVSTLATRDPKRVKSSIQVKSDRPVVFMFPGLGNHYVNMASELYQLEPVFREQIDLCAELLKSHLDLDLREVIYPQREPIEPNSTPAGGFDLRQMLFPQREVDAATQKLNQTDLAHPAILAIEYALARLWMSWGVRPQAAIGYSLGECVAATIAGVLSLKDALALVAKRAQMIQQLPSGAMLAVPLSEAQVRPLLGDRLSLATINGPSLCVVSGPLEAIATLENQLTAKGLACRRLSANHAFHSRMMEPLFEPLMQLVKAIDLKPPEIPYISNVTGTWITAAQATDPSYWAKHLCLTVRFADGLDELAKNPEPILLEVGPGQALTTLAIQYLASDRVVLPSLKESYDRQSDMAFLLSSLGKLWLAGGSIDWSGFYAGQQRHRLPLPTYPFERQRYWIEPQKPTNIQFSPEAEPQEIVNSFSSSHSRPNLLNGYVAPTNELEQTIGDLWQKLLGIDRLGIHDNFFELGGNSLLATQLIMQLREVFQIDLSLRNLLEDATIAGFARAIETSGRETPAIDLAAEAVLDRAINPDGLPAKQLTEPTSIFLTGATGFLGAYLIKELLAQTQADIYCLVRAANLAEGKKRIQKNLETYGIWQKKLNSRIIPVIGELSQPLLGLSAEQFQQMANTIDVIYHNGALVNFIYPYQILKDTNVLGTQEVLRLASQSRVKPVHYISSIAVFDSDSYSEVEIVREQEDLDRVRGLYTGYAQSKWVAEKLIAIAKSRGIPVSVYRPGNVAGDSQQGICNTSDFLFRMAKGCIQMGVAPDYETLVDITPVDYVSQALVYLSKQKESLGKVFHLVNPYPARWNEMIKWFGSFGYPMKQMSYNQWRVKLIDAIDRSQDNALYPLLALFPEEEIAIDEVSSPARMLQYDCQHTLEELIGSSIVCPPVNAELLKTYFAYFIRSGFLEAPLLTPGGDG